MSEQLLLLALPPSTSCSAGSPVKISASQAMERALAAHAPASGLSSLDSLANYDPESCSWKTSQRFLEGGFCEFSETLPRSGMMLSGALYPLPNAERRIEENGSLSWPTPRASEIMAGVFTASAWLQNRAHCNLEEVVLQAEGLRAVGRALSPQWVLAIMNFPSVWLDGLPDPVKRSLIGSRRERPKKPKSERRNSKPSGTP